MSIPSARLSAAEKASPMNSWVYRLREASNRALGGILDGMLAQREYKRLVAHGAPMNEAAIRALQAYR